MPTDTSAQALPFSLFTKVFQLHENRPWLKMRLSAIEELNGVCSGFRDVELIVDLLTQFTYLTSQDIEELCDSVAAKITTDWHLSPTDTAIVAKHFEDGRGDSSTIINNMMQPALLRKSNDWKRENFSIRAKETFRDAKFPNVVLVDDFSGSGRSASKFLKWAAKLIADEKLPPKQIYLSFFCGMEETQRRGLPADRLHVVRWLKRGISDYYTEDEAPLRMADMIRLEKMLEKLPAKYSLGFEKSETLYTAQNFNIPNNNFPIFWWPDGAGGLSRKTLFQRVL